MKQIPYGRQSIFRKDLREVIKSLSNDQITTGPYVEKFEKLMLYYEKGNLQNKKYRIINLEYNNQIVCKK